MKSKKNHNHNPFRFEIAPTHSKIFDSHVIIFSDLTVESSTLQIKIGIGPDATTFYDTSTFLPDTHFTPLNEYCNHFSTNMFSHR